MYEYRTSTVACMWLTPDISGLFFCIKATKKCHRKELKRSSQLFTIHRRENLSAEVRARNTTGTIYNLCVYTLYLVFIPYTLFIPYKHQCLSSDQRDISAHLV